MVCGGGVDFWWNLFQVQRYGRFPSPVRIAWLLHPPCWNCMHDGGRRVGIAQWFSTTVSVTAVFFTSLTYSTILKKSIGLMNSCQRYRIVPACVGVCRAYLIVHLKCTWKSSKMLCEGISSSLSFLCFQIIIRFLIFLSFFLYRLHYLL
jgi:hypothetical protein